MKTRDAVGPIIVIGIVLLLFAASGLAQEPFYKGKTVRIIVGSSAGGGYDTYTRTIARHLGKHVPGNPTFVVENMTGAGSLIAANHVYKVARPDGLTIGHFIGGLILQHVLGKPGIEFDGRKFEHLGVPAQDTTTVGITKVSGITGTLVSSDKGMRNFFRQSIVYRRHEHRLH